MSQSIFFSPEFALGPSKTANQSLNNNNNTSNSSPSQPRHESFSVQPPPASRRESDGTTLLGKFPNPVVTVTSSESTILSFDNGNGFLLNIEGSPELEVDPITGFAKNTDENDFSDLESLLNEQPVENNNLNAFNLLNSPNLNDHNLADSLNLLNSPGLNNNNNNKSTFAKEVKQESESYLVFPTQTPEPTFPERQADHSRTLSINSLHSIPSIQYTPDGSINGDYSDDASSYVSSKSDYLYPGDAEYDSSSISQFSSNSSRQSSVHLSDEEITRILSASRGNSHSHSHSHSYSHSHSHSHSRGGSVSSLDGSAIKQFSCSRCASSFTRKSRLNEHIRKIHEGKRKTYRCDKCPKILSSRENLNRHKVIHTDRYKCPNCGKKHDRSDRFHRHVLKCKAKSAAHSAMAAAINAASTSSTATSMRASSQLA